LKIWFIPQVIMMMFVYYSSDFSMAEIKVRIEGRVKRIEYLRYLASVRAEEQQAWDIGIRITRKSIEEIREEFVRVSNFDSIYINI